MSPLKPRATKVGLSEKIRSMLANVCSGIPLGLVVWSNDPGMFVCGNPEYFEHDHFVHPSVRCWRRRRLYL
jgi:hypothetical protein